MNYKAFVADKQIPVRCCRIFEKPYNSTGMMEYIMLTLNGKTELMIETVIEVKDVVVRPLSAGVIPEVRNGKIYIKLEKPCKISVEINGSFENNLAVFADYPKEEFIKDENTIVFEKGVHNTDTIVIDKDNTTLYLEDGAVINGNIRIENCSNITVCGYGMVCMEKYTYEMRKDFCRSIDVINCKNIRLSDITINDSNDWSLRINGCDNVTVENLKIFGCRGNSDGIDVCGSRNVTVQDIFTRVWDDSFVVKALGTGNAENILFKDSVLWNDFARPMEVGVELRADEVKNVRFENIDIIHSTTGYPLMGIHHGDHARVSNIVFNNIRIEDTPGAQLFDMRITNSVWNRDNTMGDIRDITFSNINYIGNKDDKTLLSNSRIEGYSCDNDIQNVSFHNIIINGKAVKTTEELGLDIYDHVKKVSVTSDIQLEEIEKLSSEINVKEEFTLGDDGFYHGSVGVKFTNKNKSVLNGVAYLAVSPQNTKSEIELQYCLLPSEEKEYICEMCLQPGKYVFYLKGDNSHIENNWLYKELDMVLERNKDIEESPLYLFRNYYNTESVGVKLAIADSSLLIKAILENEDETDFVIYTALPVPERDGEVIFSAEEVDFGEVCAIIRNGERLVAAPQLRCPAEITYVFKNEPKIEKLFKNVVTVKNGECIKISLSDLGVIGNKFIIELEAKINEVKDRRYPYTLFHSVTPEATSHMFCKATIKED